jgi:DNA-binding IclR family transcriptional regulator
MPGSIQSIERAAAIMRLLSGRSRRLGVVDLSEELGLPKGTVHGSTYLDGNELRTRTLNWSDAPAARTGEAVRIDTLHDRQDSFALAEVIREGLKSFTDATICDPDRLERELPGVAQGGWAAEIGELRAGRVSIAAAISDRTGHNVGAIGIVGPPERLLAARQPRGELVARVRDAARAVSRELGAIPR